MGYFNLGNNFNNDFLDEVQSLNDSENNELMYQDYQNFQG